MKPTKTKKRNTAVLVISAIVLVISGLLIIRTSFVPIDSFSAGCPSKKVRLSLVSGGRQKIEEVRKQADEARKKIEKFRESNPGIQVGCSIEPLYELYIL